MGSFDALQTPHTRSNRVIRPTIALFFILNFMIESNTFVLINASHLICSFPEGNGKKPVTGKSSAPALKVRARISPDTENQLLSINLGRLPDILDNRWGNEIGSASFLLRLCPYL